MKNKMNFKNIIIGILFILVIIVIAIFGESDFFSDTINNNKPNLYENIGINTEELNVLFLNVGQRR